MTRTILHQHGGPAAMAALAKTFPTFQDMRPEGRARIGVEPWDVDKFLAYARGPSPGSGARALCRFLLGVWNRTTDWSEHGLSNFTLNDVASWDREHSAAFAAWAEEPWWP